MKKVLFVIVSMDIGGTRTSLLNLLQHLSKNEDLEIELLILNHSGPYFDRIPSGIKILPEFRVISAALPNSKKRNIFEKIYRVLIYFLKIIFGYKKVYSRIYKRISNACDTYDVVIGYQEGLSNDCASFIKGRKHISWIHNDFCNWAKDEYYIKEVYERSEHIVFVADAAKNDFISHNSDLRDRCIIIKNTLDCDLIIKKSMCSFDAPKKNGVSIVSVGRICAQKAYERVVVVAEEMVKSGFQFSWRVIGTGNDIERLRDDVKSHSLSEYVFFDGATENPYPIIRNADLLVVVSIYESQPMVILEALTLGTPVLTTRFSSAEEILKEKQYGIICDNDIDAISESMKLILSDESVLNQMKICASCYEYDNESIVNSILKIM